MNRFHVIKHIRSEDHCQCFLRLKSLCITNMTYVNKLFGTNTRGVTPKLDEIGKIVREMQKDSTDRAKSSEHYNQAGMDVIKQGIADKSDLRLKSELL
jgi:hypothetical protein